MIAIWNVIFSQLFYANKQQKIRTKSVNQQKIKSNFSLFSVTDSLLAARGYSTPPVSAPYLPVSSLDLVAKNFQAAAAAAQFSQVSIFLFVCLHKPVSL